MIGIVEGVSFLILLGIAMPLKHFADLPEAVRIVGWLHGLLFIGFVVALILARDAMRWSFRWTGLVLLAALLPFGPFAIDRRLRKEDEACGALSRQSE
jgi:integral membrane protein